MRSMEGGVDLHGRKHLRVPRQMRAAGGEAGLLRARNAPSGGPDMDLGGHQAILVASCVRSVGERLSRRLGGRVPNFVDGKELAIARSTESYGRYGGSL